MTDKNKKVYHKQNQDSQHHKCGFFNSMFTSYKPKRNTGYALLCVIVPVIGLVLYFSKRKNEHKTALLCAKYALVGLIFNIVLYAVMLLASDFIINRAVDEALSAFLYSAHPRF